MYAWKVIVFVLALNITSYVISTTFTQFQVAQQYVVNPVNVDEVVSSWNPSVVNIPVIGDMISATFIFFNVFKSLLWGFPDMLEQMGLDPAMAWGLRVMVSAILVMSFLQLIRGMHMED